MSATLENVQAYASRKGLPVSEVWLLLYDKYADLGIWTESDRCYGEYLNCVMPIAE
jgi:hypothetical protein